MDMIATQPRVNLTRLLPVISFTFWDIAAGLVCMILIPLAVSLFVRARYPEAAASAMPNLAQAYNLSLLILIVLEIVLNFSDVVGLYGSCSLLASLILVLRAKVGSFGLRQEYNEK